MRERVSVINGKLPILLVAPHGAQGDDINTDVLTEEIANRAGCYAVINRGFDRADQVDVEADKADCNRVDHINEDVVYDEFLKPILKIKQRLTGISSYTRRAGFYPPQPSKHLTILNIHGCGDKIHKVANETVDVIIGYGLGTKKDSLTCKQWRKNLLVDLWRSESTSGDVFEGLGGGRYAGRNANNFNQYFRKHQLDRSVDSMQLEIPYRFRHNDGMCAVTGNKIAAILAHFASFDSYDLSPQPKFI